MGGGKDIVDILVVDDALPAQQGLHFFKLLLFNIIGCGYQIKVIISIQIGPSHAIGAVVTKGLGHFKGRLTHAAQVEPQDRAGQAPPRKDDVEPAITIGINNGHTARVAVRKRLFAKLQTALIPEDGIGAV